MGLVTDADLHRFAISDRHSHRVAGNPHLHRSAAPKHCKGHAAPFGWQPRSDGQRIAVQTEPGEAQYYRLPQTAQSGDPDAAGAIRVQFKVCGRGVTQEPKRGFGLTEPRRDECMDSRA